MNALLRRFSVLALFGALALTSSAGLTGCAVDATGALAEEDDDGDTEGDGTFDLTVRGDRLRQQAYEIPGRIPMTSSASGPSVEDPPCEGGCWPEDPHPTDPGCAGEPNEPGEPAEEPHNEPPRCGEGEHTGGHGHECEREHERECERECEGEGERRRECEREGEGEGSSCGGGWHHDD